jgi:hypothetical protein
MILGTNRITDAGILRARFPHGLGKIARSTAARICGWWLVLRVNSSMLFILAQMTGTTLPKRLTRLGTSASDQYLPRPPCDQAFVIASRLQHKPFDRLTDQDFNDKELLEALLNNVLKAMTEEARL